MGDSSEEIIIESDEEEDEQKEEEEEEQVIGFWQWAGDSPGGGHQDIWVPYSDSLCKKIEDAWNKGEKEVKVDKERFVDLQNMLQRRFDDKMKRRSVKRTIKKPASTTKTKSKKTPSPKKSVVKKKGKKLVISTPSHQKSKTDESDEEEEEIPKVGKKRTRKAIDD